MTITNISASLLEDRVFTTMPGQRIVLKARDYLLHWYGRIEVPDAKVVIDLDRILTEREIRYRPDMWANYEAGDATIRFDTFEDMLAAAKEVMQVHFAGPAKLIWPDGGAVTFKEAESA